MLGNVLLFILVVGVFFVYILLDKIFDMLEIIEKEIPLDYRSLESDAETLLAEEEPVEKSLYENKDGKYSYLEYNKNKKRREKERLSKDYIDDFEQAAEELEKPERKSKYAR